MKDRVSKARPVGSPGDSRRAVVVFIAIIALTSFLTLKLLSGQLFHGPGNSNLTKNVHLELVDWHIVGLWVMNCPCCWIRVSNYNGAPVKNVTIKYKTYGYNGEALNEGTYTMDGTVKPGSVKNFIEQYIGLVDLESDMLSVELISVEGGSE